jgi:hypothetical protein
MTLCFEKEGGGKMRENSCYTPFTLVFSKHNVIYTYKHTNLHTSTHRMEATCSSETSAASPISSWCTNPRTELTSISKKFFKFA